MIVVFWWSVFVVYWLLSRFCNLMYFGCWGFDMKFVIGYFLILFDLLSILFLYVLVLWFRLLLVIVGVGSNLLIICCFFFVFCLFVKFGFFFGFLGLCVFLFNLLFMFVRVFEGDVVLFFCIVFIVFLLLNVVFRYVWNLFLVCICIIIFLLMGILLRIFNVLW